MRRRDVQTRNPPATTATAARFPGHEIIEHFVEREQSAKQIIDETGFDAEVVLKMVRLIDLNEYKRKQAAPGLKITGRAFGFGRRMPIAQRYDNRRAVESDE